MSGTTDAQDCGVLLNTATVSASNEPQENQGNNTDSADITVLCPSLNITKIADDQSVSAGDTVGYTITVTNNGPGTAKGVVLSDTLPTNAGLDWSIAGGTGAAMLLDRERRADVHLPVDTWRLPAHASYTVVLSPTHAGIVRRGRELRLADHHERRQPERGPVIDPGQLPRPRRS